MKKSRMLLFLATGMILFLQTGGAWAYTFNDYNGSIGTYVQAWTNGQRSTEDPGLYDIVGEPSYFSTRGANLSGNTLTFFTNWNPWRDKAGADGYYLYTADLFIDSNADGVFDYAIQLHADTSKAEPNASVNNQIIDLTGYTTSDDIWKDVNKTANTYYTYGGKFVDNYTSPYSSSPLWVPVLGLGVDNGTAPVTWGAGNSATAYSVTVDLSALGLSNNWYFLWGTATCGNDTITGLVQVPEPASMLLLGIGLIGIAGVRRKFGHS